MAREKRCPICGRLCRVAAGGRSGYCRTRKSRWTLKDVPASELREGPIRHRELPDFLLDVIRWTFRVVGRYVRPTLEQWELGFMRDVNVANEVRTWHRAAFAFIAYHRRRGLPLRSSDEERKLIAAIVAPQAGGDTESSFIRQCWEKPDGWDEEVARVKGLQGSQSPRWSPPDDVADWPGTE